MKNIQIDLTDLTLSDSALPSAGEEVEEPNIAQYDATIPETDTGEEKTTELELGGSNLVFYGELSNKQDLKYIYIRSRQPTFSA